MMIDECCNAGFQLLPGVKFARHGAGFLLLAPFKIKG